MDRAELDKISAELKEACEALCKVIGAKHNKIVELADIKFKIEDNGKKAIEEYKNDKSGIHEENSGAR